ncbi:MAG: hypothetical protein WCL29_08570 [Pseudomonadota bacterium]
MKNITAIIIIGSVLAILPTVSFSKDATECVKIQKKLHGTECSNTKSVKILYANDCTVPIEIKFCVQRLNGTPACGNSENDPDIVSNKWVCEGTGKYWYQARTKGSSMKFVTDTDIDWNAR